MIRNDRLQGQLHVVDSTLRHLGRRLRAAIVSLSSWISAKSPNTMIAENMRSDRTKGSVFVQSPMNN